MIQRSLSHYPLTGLSVFGTLLFLTVFAAALYWAFRQQNASLYARVEALPLKDLEPMRDGEHSI